MRATLAVSAGTYANGISGVSLAMLATTYYLFVFIEKLGPAFLPMLSDTFVPQPGNFLSRGMLSLTAASLTVLGSIPYFSSYQPDECIPRTILFAMSAIAATNLGVVGAVCENAHAASCMGNTQVHDTTAMTFFVLYDVYMVTLLIRDLRRARRPSTAVILTTTCALSLLSKVRYLPPSAVGALLRPASTAASSSAAASTLAAAADAEARLAALLDPTADPGRVVLAMCEYLDTCSIMIFISCYASDIGRDFMYGFLRKSCDEERSIMPCDASATSTMVPAKLPTAPAAIVHLSVTLACLAQRLLSFGLFTIGFTFSIALLDGTVHPLEEWPMISDLWVAKPSNMISRYAVCLGGWLLALVQIGHFAAVAHSRRHSPRLNLLGCGLGVISAVGMVAVGACNESENLNVHYAGASIFFAGFIMWAILDLVTSAPYWIGCRRALAVVSVALLVGAKLAQLSHHLKHGSLARAGDDLVLLNRRHPKGMASMEWLASVSLMSYFYLAYTSLPETHSTCLAFYSRCPQPAQ